MPPAFEPARAWRLSPSVALRDERFGALAYHYGTRQLSFLKAPALVEVVRGLAEAPSAGAALDRAAIAPGERGAFEAARARLAATGMIVPAEDAA